MLKVPDQLPIPKLPETVQRVCDKLIAAGGHPYIVGGATIDIITGREPKDWDIEVFGMSYGDVLIEARKVAPVNLIGSKFGVVKLKHDEVDVELSVPRLENNVGPKHKDFDITLTPHISVKEAAKRRDFTINTIYYSIKDKTYDDPYDGVDDLRLGKLHYVDARTFVEDPLRAFRAVQLVARKGRVWSVGLYELIGKMIPSLHYVPGEAILGELNKLLLMADYPSIGLKTMYHKLAPGLIKLFPELEALVGCQQNPEWHPEGNAWVHTLMVVDEAARYRDEIPDDWKLAFMYGALLHDVGKPLATEWNEEKGKLTSLEHDRLGEPVARQFMERITNNQDLIDRVCSIVKVHMRPRLLLKASARRAAWRRLQNECPLDILAYISMVDSDGRGARHEREGKGEASFIKTMEVHRELGSPTAKIQPILMGRHLIAAGYKPGPLFGPMLKRAYEYQLEHGTEDIKKLLEVAKDDEEALTDMLDECLEYGN